MRGFLQIPIILLGVFIFGVVFFLVIQKSVKPQSDYKDFKINELEEQIKILREDREAAVEVRPNTIEEHGYLLLDKSKIKNSSFYTISCIPEDKLASSSLAKSISTELGDNTIIRSLCANNELNKAVFLGSDLAFGIYDLSTNKLTYRTKTSPTGGGNCSSSIYLWSKRNEIIIKTNPCHSDPDDPFEGIRRVDISGITF